MNTKTDDAENPSLHPLGRTTEGQTLNRPTGSGWWWVRMCQKTRAGKVKRGEWGVVEILELNGMMQQFDPLDGTYSPIEEGPGWWWMEWAGPLTPPVGPTVASELQNPAKTTSTEGT